MFLKNQKKGNFDRQNLTGYQQGRSNISGSAQTEMPNPFRPLPGKRTLVALAEENFKISTWPENTFRISKSLIFFGFFK